MKEKVKVLKARQIGMEILQYSKFIDIRPRQMGKTTRMIEWLGASEKRLLITFSFAEAKRLKVFHPELAERIIDWNSYKADKKVFPSSIEECGIDNADLVLMQEMKSRHCLTKITMTNT